MENSSATDNSADEAVSSNYTLVFMPVILALLEKYHTVRASWTDVTVFGDVH